MVEIFVASRAAVRNFEVARKQRAFATAWTTTTQPAQDCRFRFAFNVCFGGVCGLIGHKILKFVAAVVSPNPQDS
jgi:hypothetical protein